MGGDQMVVPPRELLGHFNSPGQCEALGDWLLQLPRVEALLVSVDMLAYGGLIASRHTGVSTAAALARLAVLKRFRAAHPATAIYGFSILMRLAVTMDSDEAVSNYYNVMRYARLCDEAERFDSAHLRHELDKVTAQIPPAVLAEYLAARARNHDINGAMLDWLQEGVFDYLLITQEDAAEYGLHRREQDALAAHTRTLGVEARTSLHPGADEAALTLLARHWNTGVSFAVHVSRSADMQHIAPFEDRPYQQALTQHVCAMGGRLQTSEGEAAPADFALYINAPVGSSQKDETSEQRAQRALEIAPFIEELAAAAAGGQQQALALCDVAFPNGADNLLLGELDKRGLLGGLTCFGGWNTAGNTTGTVLAQCAALKRVAAARGGQVRATALSRNFTFERLVDDWFYQSQVRAHVERAAREAEISPLNMGEAAAAPIEALTRRELRGLAQLLAKRHFRSTLREAEVALPWARTFEADVRMKLA
jgi:hypothetical protein